MDGSILQVDGLKKSFDGLKAVDGISFHIALGESYGLLGPNGAGKTTTISMICGLLNRDAGSVTVDGVDLDRQPLAVKQKIGYVPQNVALYQDLTATENLKFWGKLYGLKGDLLNERVEAVLEMVGLTDRARDKVGKYSGGMMRRMNIAAGLLHEPRLLVLDEPTVGVDAQSRNAILGYVEALKGGGTAILYTTHYMEEAERLCDRIGIVDEGKLLAEGSQEQLVAKLPHDGGDLEEVFLHLTGKALRD